MSSESEIQECKRIFLEKMAYRGSPKLPTELAAYLLLKSEKAIDEFFERKKNEELAREKRPGVGASNLETDDLLHRVRRLINETLFE